MFFLPPLPKVQYPNFLDFRNPWGKVMKRRGLRLKTFTNKGCKITAQKCFFFSANFELLSRICWYSCYYLHVSTDSLSPVCGISYHTGTKQQLVISRYCDRVINIFHLLISLQMLQAISSCPIVLFISPFCSHNHHHHPFHFRSS